MPKRSCISIHPGGLGVGEGISPAAGASDQQVTQFYHTKDYPLKSSIVKPQGLLKYMKRLLDAGALYGASYIREP